MNILTSASTIPVSPGRQGDVDSHVPNSARPRHGTRNRCRPDAVRPPIAASPDSRRVTRFITFSIGMPVEARSPSNRLTPPPVALTVTRAPISISRPSTVSRARTPTTRPPSVDERERLDVIGQDRTMSHGGEREGERQPIGFGRDVVVPDRGIATAMFQAGKAPQLGARHDTSGRQLMRGSDSLISIEGDEAIESEPGAHGGRASRDRSIERQHERDGADDLRRDRRKRPPLDHRFARSREVERLQIPKPAVDRPEMVERGAAAEVGAFDQRDRQAALGRVIRDRQAVDAAADDEHVEGTAGERGQITAHWIVKCRLKISIADYRL